MKTPDVSYEIIGVFVYKGHTYLNINEFGKGTTPGSIWIDFCQVSDASDDIKKWKKY